MRPSRTIFFATLLLTAPATYGQVDYTERAATRGLGNVGYGNGLFGGGLSFVDIDGDGWDDLTFTTDDSQKIRCFMNNAGQFTEVLPPPVQLTCESKQVLWVDFDNDGDKDLFTTCHLYLNQSMPNGQSRLYRNDGNWSLVDITQQAGLLMDSLPTFGANFGDVDNDGWLDLIILNRVGPSGTADNMLFLNNGNSTFTNVTVGNGFTSDSTMAFCAGMLDLDRDGWQDIYIAEDKHFVNKHFKNDGTGSFNEIGAVSGANIAIDAMSVTHGDYNNDGWLDIYVTNTQAGNALLQGSSTGTFTEVAAAAGVGYYRVGWGANFVDVDLDMDEDLYVSGTFPPDPFTESECYRNEGNGTFTDTVHMGFEGDTTVSYSNAIGDVNNDGWPDIMISNEDPFDNQLWMTTPGPEHWLKVRLTGMQSNRDGIGSYIEVYVGGVHQLRYTTCGTGYLAQNSLTQMFGLSTFQLVDSMVITWPSGIVDRLYGLAVDQVVDVVEGSTMIGMGVQGIADAPALWIQGDHLTSDRPMQGTIEILDAMGRLVVVRRVQGMVNLPINDLPAGAYRARSITSNGATSTLSFARDR